MKKLVALFLCVVIVFSFVSCGIGENKLFGSWTGEVDLSDMFTKAMVDEGFTTFKTTDFKIIITYIFNEDGTYCVKCDEYSTKAAFEVFKKDIAGPMGDQLVDSLKDQGYDLTLAETLTLLGYDSIDAYIDTVFTQESIMGTMTAGFEAEGKYTTEWNRFYTSESLTEEVNEEEYYEYSIDGDKLTITESGYEEGTDFSYTLTKNQ